MSSATHCRFGDADVLKAIVMEHSPERVGWKAKGRLAGRDTARIYEATGARPSGRFSPGKEECRCPATGMVRPSAIFRTIKAESRAEAVKRRKRRAPERGLQAASCVIAAKSREFFPGSRAKPTLRRHECRAPDGEPVSGERRAAAQLDISEIDCRGPLIS